jgi:hypothetical protein
MGVVEDVRGRIFGAFGGFETSFENNPLVDSFNGGSRLGDRLFANFGLGLAHREVRWASFKGEGKANSFYFQATLWTDDIVLHCVGSSNSEEPVVTVSMRSELERIEILSAPLSVRTNSGSEPRATALGLTYPGFIGYLEDQQSAWLPQAMSSLIADLSSDSSRR